jgi:hypothetical protein
MACVGLAALRKGRARTIDYSVESAQGSSAVDAAVAQAAWFVLGRTEDGRGRAVQVLDEALAGAPSGSAGWTIPLEPLLDVQAAPDAWAPVLARLRGRAA